MLRVDNKEKIQTLIAQQRINPAEVSYLDLDSAAKIVEEFENPPIPTQEISSESENLTSDNDSEVSFRTAPSFKDGEQLPIQGEKGAYFVEGLTGGYQNADYLLDAFRSKYPEYLAELNEDKTAIVVEPWSKYLGPTTSKKGKLCRRPVSLVVRILPFTHTLAGCLCQNSSEREFGGR